MFIRNRAVEGTDKIKIVICKSVRSGDRVVQKIMRQIGIARNDSELKVFTKAAEFLMHEVQAARSDGVLFDDFDVLND